eukprot:2124628-Pyramimonas_sp.AAC.1
MLATLVYSSVDIHRGVPDADAVRVQLLHPKANAPQRGSDGAAAYDITTVTDGFQKPGQRRGFHTGLKLALPAGTAGQLWPRSGLALRQGLGINGGVIDADYRGELIVILENRGSSRFECKCGDRIAQLMI